MRTAGLALVLVGALAIAGPAHASSCAYSPTTRTVTITITGDSDGTAVQAGATGTIYALGVQCDTAETSNTSTIDIVGDAGKDQRALIELDNPYEFNGVDIRFNVDLGAGTGDSLVIEGADVADNVRAGSAGINLDAGDSDADVFPTASVEQVELKGADGPDMISAAGGAGTGAAYPTPITVEGGLGNDTLTGGDANDVLAGDEGTNTLDGGPGVDRASYELALVGVVANLATHTGTADGTDTHRTWWHARTRFIGSRRRRWWSWR